MTFISWLKKQLFNQSSNTTLTKSLNSQNDFIDESRTTSQYNSLQPEIDKRLKQPLKEGILPGDIILLDWANNKSEHVSTPIYFEYQYGIDADSHRKKLIDLGYLRVASPSESLRSLVVPKLKNILRDNNLKVSGKKLDLIHRITDNIDESLYSKTITDFSLICTPTGRELLQNHSNLVWAHKHDSKDNIINVANALNQSQEEMQSKFNYSRSIQGRTESMLAELKENGANSYEILGALDKSTCDKCGAMDGRVFQSTHIKPGINFPPFHDGCRCTIVPHGIRPSAVTERISRNPKTGKAELISDRSFTEWHNDMIREYGKDVFK